MAFVIGRYVLWVEGNLMAKACVNSMSIYGIKHVSVCCHSYSSTTPAKHFYKFYFTHCIHQQKLSFTALIILELFRIMLSK